jgi:hypothetical protein
MGVSRFIKKKKKEKKTITKAFTDKQLKQRTKANVRAVIEIILLLSIIALQASILNTSSHC